MDIKWISINDDLPKKKEGWDHSQQVLLWYDGIPNDKVEGYGIGYYNYDPPFQEPCFTDFAHYGRVPTHWACINPPNSQ